MRVAVTVRTVNPCPSGVAGAVGAVSGAAWGGGWREGLSGSDANLSLFPVPGECTIFAAVRDLMVNLTLPPGGRP